LQFFGKRAEPAIRQFFNRRTDAGFLFLRFSCVSPAIASPAECFILKERRLRPLPKNKPLARRNRNGGASLTHERSRLRAGETSRLRSRRTRTLHSRNRQRKPTEDLEISRPQQPLPASVAWGFLDCKYIKIFYGASSVIQVGGTLLHPPH
jgi:hypothetical protein